MPALTRKQCDDLYDAGWELAREGADPTTHPSDAALAHAASIAIWLALRAFAPKSHHMSLDLE